jgi:REP element-mobilizing transposase RayT
MDENIKYDDTDGLKSSECDSPQPLRPRLPQRKSIRLKGYDYSQAGLYFITICCEDRVCHFGHIDNGQMILNEFGQIAYNEWLNTLSIRKNLELYEFIIMPNHMHGIIVLNGMGELHSPENNDYNIMDECDSPERDVMDGNKTCECKTGECKTGECKTGEFKTGECNSPLRSSVGAIVRGFKSSVTKQIRLIGFDKKLWQRNYHDHIIRNEQSYLNIANYIINNPAKWEEDKFYKK